MDKTEIGGIEPGAELIHSIGRMHMRGAVTTTDEGELMQRASDPLLIAEFLSRRRSPPAVVYKHVVKGEAIFSIAQYGVIGGLSDPPSLYSASERFRNSDSLAEAGVKLSQFEPSCEDRETAIEIEPRFLNVGLSAPRSWMSMVSGGVGLTLVLLWFLIRTVSG